MTLAGDHVQVLVGGFELTADSNRIVIEDKRKMYDLTTFSDAAQKYLAGQRSMNLEHAGFMNSAAARSHPVFRQNQLDTAVSVLVGQNAAPAVGNPLYCLAVLQTKYSVMPEVGKVIPFNAKFANKEDRGGWGVALAVPTTITNTTSGSAVDNGAATVRGGAAFLHILQASVTDTYSIIVEGATNVGFSTGVVTLATFTLNALALGAQRIGITGNIPQFTRYRATRTGAAGNPVRLAVGLVRF